MPPQSIPETPRRFGSQFYTDPEFFMNTEPESWLENPHKTVTEGALFGGVISDILSAAEQASDHPPLTDMGFPTQEELTTSVGAVTLSSISEMLPIVAEKYVESHPEGQDKGYEEIALARDLGLQGARDWWAGNVAGAGGGGHAPRGGHESELPTLQFSDKKFEPDPHALNTDVTFEGHIDLVREYGLPDSTHGPKDIVKTMLTPISEVDIDPDDFDF